MAGPGLPRGRRVARYRIADPAKADLAAILATSRQRHGEVASCGEALGSFCRGSLGCRDARKTPLQDFAERNWLHNHHESQIIACDAS